MISPVLALLFHLIDVAETRGHKRERPETDVTFLERIIKEADTRAEIAEWRGRLRHKKKKLRKAA